MHQFLRFTLFLKQHSTCFGQSFVHHQEFKTVHAATVIRQTATSACLLLFDIYLLMHIQSWTPDDGRKDHPKHVQCSKNKVNLRNWCILFDLLRKYIMMHGFMNVENLYSACARNITITKSTHHKLCNCMKLGNLSMYPKYHAAYMLRESTGAGPHILNVCRRWRWTVNFTVWSTSIILFKHTGSLQYQLNRSVELNSWYGHEWIRSLGIKPCSATYRLSL
jgi:hypothetical protein